jgi:flagellin
MSMVVKNNISALNTLNVMNKNNSALTKSLQKVSSGEKINSAADDASGYAISEKMKVQIRSLDQANQNSQNGSSLLKTAEGAVSSTVDILKTLKEKVVNAANDTNTTSDRQTIQKELNQAIDQINDNANVTFNGKTLVDGSMNKQIKSATTTVYTNQSLATASVAASALTDLKDRDGNAMDIKSSDTIKVSFVQNGKTFTTSYAVSSTTLASIFSKATTQANTTGYGFGTGTQTASFIAIDATGVSTYTADGSSAFSVVSATSGTTGQISGFSISITGTDGNVKKSINQKLDDFSETIRAQNKSGNNALNLQIGTKSNQSITVGLTDMRAQALGLQGTDAATGVVKNIDVTTRDNANVAINVMDSAIQKALDEQTNIGSVESRLDYTSSNLTSASENVTSAESTIRDANMASEMTEYTKNNVLMQASQAMLAQANQSTSKVLSLLQ